MKPPISICALLAAFALPVLALESHGRVGAQNGTRPQEPSVDLEAQRAAKAENEKAQAELAAAYFAIADYDSDGWISFREARLSLEIDRSRFHVYDENQNGQITVEEYTFVSLETYRRYGAFKAPLPNPDDPLAASQLEALRLKLVAESIDNVIEYVPAEADSILELFGRVTQRVRRQHTAPEPDQIVGPVFSYRRLDYDNNGSINRDDLDVLLLGSGLDVRPNALIASLDLDGDNAISEEEFLLSMSNVSR